MVFIFVAAITAHAQVITAVAGGAQQGYNGDGGPAVNAWLSFPTGIAFDSGGNLYFADTGNRVVRQVNTQGTISTFAGNQMVFFGGSGDGGQATNAGFGWGTTNYIGLAVDQAGNMFLSDTANGIWKVRKVDASGVITTFAGGGVGSGGDGGPATSAGLGTAAGLAVDAQGNLYIADTVGQRIRKVNLGGIISTVAGTGTAGYSGEGVQAANAPLSVPTGVTVDAQQNIYITEAGNAQYGPRVRKIDLAGNITTVAGNGKVGFSGDGGPATSAQLGGGLQGVAVDKAGNVYIADYSNYRIRKVDTSGIITTIAGNGQPGGSGVNGNGGLAASSELQPSGLAVDPSGNLYISDYFASQIREITFGAAAPGLSASAASLYFAARAGQLASPQQQNVTISTSGPTLTYTISATTASGGSWLGTSSASGTTPGTVGISVNISPGGTALAAGTYKGALTFTPTTPGYTTPIAVNVTLVLTATIPSQPVISAVVSSASFQQGQPIAPNSFVTITGTNLSTSTDTWSSSIVGGQLPTSIDGVTVTFSSYPGYISYVSPTQINVLVPPGPVGTASVQVVNNGAVSSGQTVGLAQASPAFFLLNGGQIVATRQDYTYAVPNGTIPGLATTPAKPGDVLILWGTGFGATNPATLPGQVTPNGKTYSTSQPVTVTINNVTATVYGTALTPGVAGLYQVAIQVPVSLGSGSWNITASTQGFSSPSGAVLSVQQ